MGLIPVETRLVPIVLALRDGYPQLLMAPVDPTVVMNIHAHRGPNRRTAQGDPGAWIAQLVAPQLHGVALTSKFTSLLPRPIRDGQLAIPVWATARVDPNAAPDPNLPIRHSRHFREPMLVDARDGLERLGDELGDPDFGREVLAAVRATLAADPFAQRVMGDGVRLGALLGDRRTGDPGPGLPAIVALLPSPFTLTALRDAVAAALGMHPREFDFGSGLRRRINEFVLMRVLREVGSTRDLPDHGGEAPSAGRPSRCYEFDEDAWRMWLRERGERGAGAGPKAYAPQYSRDIDTVSDMVMGPRESMDRPEGASRPLGQPGASRAPGSQGGPAPGRAGADAETADRILRLERMVDRLAMEIKKRMETE
jgi:hypothetical protein